jgi:deoxyribodipyrimidine photo-lyase
MKRKRVIVWFRQDLRLHDNEALTDALKSGEEVIPVYVFDERIFKGRSRFGFRKTELFRARFIIESVKDLKKSLRLLGSDLIIRIGKPEEEIFEIAQKLKSSWIFCNRERTRDEVMVQDALEENLWTIGQEIIYSRGKMLYYTQDLPFPVTHCPDSFKNFRKEVERIVQIREPLPKPDQLFKPLTIEIENGEIPALEDLGYEDIPNALRDVMNFKGGETEGLKRLQYYLWESKKINSYDERRNELLGDNFSSKFSAWLSQGCLSPKMIYHELKKFESERGDNKSIYSMYLALLRRDFFRLIGKKHGNNIFLKGGIVKKANPDWKNDRHLLNLWKDGRTGVPFVDANMREIKHTGYMSIRGRKCVSQFLIKDLQVNWQMGAEYFESMLIDYDPCSNWGNWNCVAGVGIDIGELRNFNIIAQAKRYDPMGLYVKKWLPELSVVPENKIHLPDTMSIEEQNTSQVRIGSDYPKSMISSAKWV